MYFAFIDESGNPDLKDINNKFYVLVAFIMHEKGFPFLNDNIKLLRAEIWDQVKNKDFQGNIPTEFELHVKEITSGLNYYETIKDNFKTQMRILEQIYDFISHLYGKVIAVIIPKDEYYSIYKEDMAVWAFKLLVERLHRYILVRKRYKEEYILIVMDRVGDEEDNKRRAEIEQYMLYGTGGGEHPENVIETPFIGDSKIHKGVQIADAIAYLLRRHTRKHFGINPESVLNQYVDKFMEKITGLFYIGSKWTPRYVIKFFPWIDTIPDGFWNIFKK